MAHISWNEYFMGVASLSAKRSKDPSTQVGACVVNQDKRIIGIGYNGFPMGCSDDVYPWGKSANYLDSKYPYVVHAEPNAILNCTSSLKGATLYVTHSPCNDCCKSILTAGIKEVVFLNLYDRETEGLEILAESGVTIRQLTLDKTGFVTENMQYEK